MIPNQLSSHVRANAAEASGILSQKPEQEVLSKLIVATKAVTSAFNNQQTQAGAAKDAERCWEYATHIPDSRLALLACQICKENLPEQGPDSLDRYRTDFTLVVGGKKIALPCYYQTILAKASPYFKALFEGNFSEKQTGAFRIEDIEYSHFRTLLAFLHDGEFKAKEMALDEVRDLLLTADRLQLKGAIKELVDHLADAIKSLVLTDEHCEIVHEIALSLEETSIYRDNRLHEAVDAYFKQATDQCVSGKTAHLGKN